MQLKTSAVQSRLKLVFCTLTILLFNLNCFVAAQTRVVGEKKNPFKKPMLIRNTPSTAARGGSRVVSPDRSINRNPNMPAIVKVRPSSDSQASVTASDINAAEVLEPSEGNLSDEIAINFEAVDLMSLVRYMSQETGKGFIINQPLQGEVTIISPVTLNRDEALAMLESILQVRGYTAVPSGKMYKIVALSDAKVAGTETRTSSELSELSEDDTLITQIVPLERTSVEEASKLLQNLLPRDASMLLFPQLTSNAHSKLSESLKRACSSPALILCRLSSLQLKI
jgi:hypothetical protein